MNFIDEKGECHSAIAECKQTKGVNGEKSLSGTIYTNETILQGIGRGWRIVFKDEIYCLTYVNPIDEGTRIVVEFDAVHEFFFDMQKSATYTVLNGSNMAESYLDHIFHDSGYEYRLEVAIPAFEKENFGMKNRLELFKDFISSTGVEFSVSGRVVRILEKVGTNLATIVKKGFNLNELHIEKDIRSFITYLKGYGAYKDPDDESKGRLIVEYLSPFAEIYGKLEGDPVVDERYKVESNFIERLKNDVESSYRISVDIDMEDLTKAGYEYDQPHEGDYIMAINKDLGFEQKIRILSYTTSYDTEETIIDHKISCGSLNLIQQSQTDNSSWKKQMEQSIDEAKQTANFALISADGESMIYYGPDEPTGTQFRKGATWYQTIGDKQVLKVWNGAEWWPLLDESEIKAIKKEFEEQTAELEQAKKQISENNTKVQQAIADVGFAKDGLTAVEKKAIDALKKGQDVLNDVNAIRKKVTDAEGNITSLASQFGYLSDELTSVVTKSEDLNVQVSELKQTATGFQKNVTDQIAGMTTRLSSAEQNATTFKNSISEQVNGFVTRLTESEQNAKGFQQRITDQLKGVVSQQTQLSDQYTSVIETITKNDETVRTQLSQMTTQFNLYVQKGNVIGQLNLEAGKTLIQNKQLVLDAETTILTGKAFIPMAMIKDLRVDAATIYGTLDASKVRTINIDAANISSGYINNDRLRSRSITADKLATNAIQVGFNIYSQNLKLDPSSLNFYNGAELVGKITSSGMEFWDGVTKIGYMGKTYKKDNNSVRGVAMNLEVNGDFVSWGYKKSSSIYEAATSQLTLDMTGRMTGKKGIHLDADVYITKVKPGYSNAKEFLEFSVVNYSNSAYSGLLNASGKSGIFMGGSWLYLLHDNKVIPVEDIRKVVYALKGVGKIHLPTNFYSTGGGVQAYKTITL